MMVEFKAYEEKYKDAVIDCLRRNYEWMGQTDRDIVKDWAEPILSYQWQEKTDNNAERYYYGIVLMDKDAVVGYLGFIYYSILYNGEWKSCGNLTTAAIDEEYRGKGYSYDLFNMARKTVDYCFDITPSLPVRNMLVKKFQAKMIDNQKFLFYPIPFEKSEKIRIKWIESENEIEDAEILRVYKDHKNIVNIKLIFIEEIASGISTYLFYKSRHFNGAWGRILKVTNGRVLASHAHEIIWKIMKQEHYTNAESQEEAYFMLVDRIRKGEKVCMECDSRFLTNNEISHPMYNTREVFRMLISDSDDFPADIDLMYSEYAILL